MGSRFLLPGALVAFGCAQEVRSKSLMTFKDYPQRQKAASFNLEAVLKKLQESGGSK